MWSACGSYPHRIEMSSGAGDFKNVQLSVRIQFGAVDMPHVGRPIYRLQGFRRILRSFCEKLTFFAFLKYIFKDTYGQWE